MKEAVLKILNESPKSVDATFIMNKTNENYTPEELKKLFDELDQMETEGLIVRNKSNEFMPFERSNLLKGKVEITKTGNGFLLLGNNNDLFISKNEIDNFNIMDGDEIICEIRKFKKGKEEGKIVRILKRNLSSKIGEIYFDNGIPKVKIKDNNGLNIELKKTDTYLVDGMLVKLKFVKNISNKAIEVEIDKVICHKNAPDKDILEILAKNDIPTEFSEEVLKEAASMPKEIKQEDLKGREDLRNKIIFTIDGADTKDIDDAISVEILDNNNYLLGVHIADVSYYVREGSYIKIEALNRGNSVYLADRVVPMLPIELSNGICSLNPNVDRLAISCEMEINHKGKIVNARTFKSVIKSNKKMTYEEVNKLFNGNPSEEYLPYKDVLETMLELSNIIDNSKKERGEVDFCSPEVKLIIDENSKVIGIKRREEGKGQNLIENFMISANTTIGNLLFNLGSPAIYRVHKSPTEENMKDAIKFISILGHSISGKINYSNITSKDIKNILEQLKESKDYHIINDKMLRSMQKAIYLQESLGHFALALKNYTHFTSPIRRYCDLMVHFFLDEAYFKDGLTQGFKDNWDSALSYICEHISETEKRAETTEREVDDMKIAEYMEGHIGEEYEAIVNTTLPKGFFVETEDLISGFVKLENLPEYYKYREELLGYINNKGKVVIRLGDKVKVKCIAASKEEQTVDFIIIGKA
jgi:ribonuclease R